MDDPRRAETERDLAPKVGPTFFKDGDITMFRFVIDTGNVVGPRPATRADQEKHAEAWSAFAAREDVSPLDRDGSGEEGGSLPGGETSPVVAEDGHLTTAPKRKYTRRKKS